MSIVKPFIFWKRADRHVAARNIACLSAAGALLLSGCASQTQLGAGGSAVSGSGGSAGAQGASGQMVHCTRSLGTAALVEPNSQDAASLTQLGLQSPLPLLRLIMAQSGCFRVVDRGAALNNMQQEVGLAQNGMLKNGSATAQGRMLAAQYLLTPSVIFSNPDAGGANMGSALGGLFPGGALVGALAASMRVQEAQTTLFVTDAQSGEQVAVSEGSARVRDFGGAAGLGGFGGGIAGFAGVAGYGNTAEGKLIAAALLDGFNKLVTQIQATRGNLAGTSGGLSASSGTYTWQLGDKLDAVAQKFGVTRQAIMAANPGLSDRYASKQYLKQGEVINLP
jgi:phage tail protein X